MKVLAFFLFPLFLIAQPQETWKVLYDHQGFHDETTHLVFDKEGNLIWVNSGNNNNSYTDIALHKYTTTGELVWSQVYKDSLDFVDDIPRTVHVGENNSLWIGGMSNWNFLTVNYDEEGNKNWENVIDYDTRGNLEEAYSIISDHQNNSYVTGGTRFDTSVLVKYDASGEEVWQRFLPFPIFSIGQDIFIDNTDNLYVSASVINFPDSTSTLLAKYTTDGDLIWKTMLRNPPNLYSSLIDSEMDKEGNLVLLLRQSIGLPKAYTHVLKYTPQGEMIWEQIIDDGESFPENYPKDLLIDYDDNIYLAGINTSDSLYIQKLSSQGNSLWIQKFEFPAADSYTFDIDPHNNIYLLLTRKLYKLQPDGNLVWEYNIESWAASLLIQDERTLYIGGDQFSTENGRDAYLMQLIDTTVQVGLTPSNIMKPALTIMPNPVQQELQVSIPETFVGKNASLIIYDLTGRVVRNILLKTTQKAILATTDWANGLYMAHLMVNGKIVDRKKILMAK